MSESRGASGGVSLATVLFLVFLVLKLTHLIDWSWWWVTLPLWGPVVAAVALGIVGFVIYGVYVGIKAAGRRRDADDGSYDATDDGDGPGEYRPM